MTLQKPYYEDTKAGIVPMDVLFSAVQTLNTVDELLEKKGYQKDSSTRDFLACAISQLKDILKDGKV